MGATRCDFYTPIPVKTPQMPARQYRRLDRSAQGITLPKLG